MLTDTNKAATPEPVITYIGTTLKKGTDYTVSYQNNNKAGKGTVVITGTGTYYGTVKAEFEVVDAQNLLDPAECANGKSSLRAAGEESSAGISFNTPCGSEIDLIVPFDVIVYDEFMSACSATVTVAFSSLPYLTVTVALVPIGVDTFT